ncbi:hypothetical protein [Rhodococcus sp. KRD197]|uniref:hypothetical protein n=1 Tax=unclassified Rhodococcus (in: high G+C Gram-positive bacteria) TaxID=192944 RepID=UPI001F493BCF|nr:hypothetical protein [Rhodococcus sp. KRD197]
MGSKGPASRGQKRAAKTKARQRRREPSSGSRLHVFPTGLLEEFEQWLADREMADHAERVVGLVRTTLVQVDRANPDFSVTSWTPNDAHFIVDAAERIEDSDEENGAAAATNIIVTLVEFLTFLDETDTWTGTDEDFAHCMEDLTDFIYNDPDVLDPEDVELPEVSDADESAALSALPLMAGLDGLLDEVGSGRPATEIPALAHALSESDADADPTPQSIIALDRWATALAADILDFDGEQVRPGPESGSFSARSTAVMRSVLTQSIRHQLTAGDVDISMSLANTFAVQTLLAAMTEDLPLDNAPENGAEENYDGLKDEDLRTAQLIDFRIRSLQEQGVLVRNDDSLEVPASLRRAVLEGVTLAEPFGAEDPSESF